jgi:hypothetical protein
MSYLERRTIGMPHTEISVSYIEHFGTGALYDGMV